VRSRRRFPRSSSCCADGGASAGAISSIAPSASALDEFQWLWDAQPAIDSILQRHWDRWQRAAVPVTEPIRDVIAERSCDSRSADERAGDAPQQRAGQRGGDEQAIERAVTSRSRQPGSRSSCTARECQVHDEPDDSRVPRCFTSTDPTGPTA
jgi:hypothetical protein